VCQYAKIYFVTINRQLRVCLDGDYRQINLLIIQFALPIAKKMGVSNFLFVIVI